MPTKCLALWRTCQEDSLWFIFLPGCVLLLGGFVGEFWYEIVHIYFKTVYKQFLNRLVLSGDALEAGRRIKVADCSSTNFQVLFGSKFTSNFVFICYCYDCSFFGILYFYVILLFLKLYLTETGKVSLKLKYSFCHADLCTFLTFMMTYWLSCHCMEHVCL